jgi:hypothetical protein
MLIIKQIGAKMIAGGIEIISELTGVPRFNPEIQRDTRVHKESDTGHDVRFYFRADSLGTTTVGHEVALDICPTDGYCSD